MNEKWRFYTPNIWVITLKMKVVGSHGTSHPNPPRPAILGDLRTTKCRIFATNPTLEPLEEVTEPGADVFNEDAVAVRLVAKNSKKKTTEIQMGCCVCQKWTTTGGLSVYQFIMVGIYPNLHHSFWWKNRKKEGSKSDSVVVRLTCRK